MRPGDPVVVDQWHPVAAVDEIPAEAVATTLLDEPIAIANPGGTPVAWRANGFEREPPAPGDPRLLPVRTDFGYLWTSIGLPPPKVFSIPEVHEPGRIIHNAVTIGVNVSAPRAVENFLDVAHLAFVHAGYLGEAPHTEIVDYEVSTVDGEVTATGIRIYQPRVAAGATAGEVAEYAFRVPHPHCGVLYKKADSDPDRVDIYAGFVHALSEERIRLHLFDCVVDGGSPVVEIRKFVQAIVGQDKAILENQSPKRLPLDPRYETPVRADKLSIAYRRYLSEIGLRYGVIRAPETVPASGPPTVQRADYPSEETSNDRNHS